MTSTKTTQATKSEEVETMTANADKAYWSQMSDTYDSHLKKSAKMYEKMTELIKNELRGRGTVLDMGTGTGEIPLEIAEHVSRVEAIDYSEEMIEAAKRKAAARGIGNVIFRVQNCHQLHYDDGTFDAVIAANTLHVVPDPEKVLAEAHRVLRDEGILLAPTFVHNESFRTRVISWLLSKKGHPIHTKFDSELLRTMIDRNGFQVIRQEFLENIMPASYIVAQKG